MEYYWINFVVDNNRENGAESVVRGVGLDNDLGVQILLNKDQSASEGLLQ